MRPSLKSRSWAAVTDATRGAGRTDKEGDALEHPSERRLAGAPERIDQSEGDGSILGSLQIGIHNGPGEIGQPERVGSADDESELDKVIRDFDAELIWGRGRHMHTGCKMANLMEATICIGSRNCRLPLSA